MRLSEVYRPRVNSPQGSRPTEFLLQAKTLSDNYRKLSLALCSGVAFTDHRTTEMLQVGKRAIFVVSCPAGTRLTASPALHLPLPEINPPLLGTSLTMSRVCREVLRYRRVPATPRHREELTSTRKSRDLPVECSPMLELPRRLHQPPRGVRAARR